MRKQNHTQFGAGLLTPCPSEHVPLRGIELLAGHKERMRRRELLQAVTGLTLFLCGLPPLAAEDVSRPATMPVIAGAPVVEAASKFSTRNPRYRIEPSDVLELSFRFTPEFNQTVTVPPDGHIALQAVGELKVSGITVAEATDAIRQRYSSILREPVLTMVLKEFNKPGFLVGGEVARPGRFDLRGQVTVSDAVTIAGGFSPAAKTTEVLLFRRVSTELAEVRRVNVKTTLEKGLAAEDPQLQPGDSIYVPKSRMGKIDRFMSITRLGLYFNPLPARY